MFSLKLMAIRPVLPLLLLSGILQGTLGASVVFQSTTDLPQGMGSSIGNSSFYQNVLGVRFELDQTTVITSIGVYAQSEFVPSPTALFGEIFPISDLTYFNSYPSTPLSATGLGRSYFTSPGSTASTLLAAPLSLTLSPGDYAFVVGTDSSNYMFPWAVPGYGTDAPGISSSNFISWSVQHDWFSPPYPHWQTSTDGMRFFLNGPDTATPEPSSYVLSLTGGALILLAALISRRRKLRA